MGRRAGTGRVAPCGDGRLGGLFAGGLLVLCGVFCGGAILSGCGDPARSHCATTDDCDGGRVCVEQRCVAPTRCRADRDCAAPQLCLEDRCQARSCAFDADCPGERTCRQGWCAAADGARCRTDDDCPSGACDPASGLCAVDACPGGGCESVRCAEDAGCPAEQYCALDAICRPGCRLTREACGPQAVCDARTRTCAQDGCVADDACPDGTYCDDGACLPGCRLLPDSCGAGRCDVVTRRCVCRADADCAVAEYCAEDGVCRPGCRLDSETCAPASCDPITRGCAPRPCVDDGQCPPTAVCAPAPDADGLVCRPALGPGRAEAPCAADAECASGLCLDVGVCFAGCAADAGCPSGRCAAVELPDGRRMLACVPALARCRVDADCGAGRACLPEALDDGPGLACVLPIAGAPAGAPCTAAAECASADCLDGRCWSPCVDDTHCPAETRCHLGARYLVDDRGSPETEDDRAVGVGGCRSAALGSATLCVQDAGCPEGELCAQRPSPDRSALEGRCLIPSGPAADGAPCAVDGDCRRGWCLEGRCLGRCSGDPPSGDCAAGTVCAPWVVQVWDRETPEVNDDIGMEVIACVPR